MWSGSDGKTNLNPKFSKNLYLFFFFFLWRKEQEIERTRQYPNRSLAGKDWKVVRNMTRGLRVEFSSQSASVAWCEVLGSSLSTTKNWTREVQVGGSEIQGYPRLLGEPGAILGYLRTC